MAKVEEPIATDVVASVSHHDTKEGLESIAHRQEHELTLSVVFTKHKAVIAWCLYWAMCAIGW
jgi:hypothetical protein